MNILMATYSYFPYSFGGTEVYVSGLAGYLFLQGHSVTVIAAAPPHAFNGNDIFFEDENLKAVKYEYGAATVVGVQMNNISISEIYAKQRKNATASWRNLLQCLKQKNWDIVHFHAHTATINQYILYAVKEQSPWAKVFFSYHLPVSCVKGTLIYSNTLKDCQVKPSPNICTACYISDRKNIPLAITRPLAYLLPVSQMKNLPFELKVKGMVKNAIISFQEVVSNVDMWFVFSNQVREVLIKNGASLNSITLLQHGVENIFLRNKDVRGFSKRNAETITFLYAGRFDVLKGFHTLLKSWSSLKEDPIRKLEIAGELQVEHNEIKEAMQLVKDRNDVIWLGKKTQTELSTIMERAHCTIIPSEWVEIGPLVFHEAISKGSDVIASDIGGCKTLAQYYPQKSTMFRAGDSVSLQKAISNFKYSGISLKVNEQGDNYRAVEQVYHNFLEYK